METKKQFTLFKFQNIKTSFKFFVLSFAFGLFSQAVFAQSNPCSLTEVHKDNSVIMKGEMNYVSAEDKSLRVSVQFQMVNDELGFNIGINNAEGLAIDSTNVAFIQLSNGKEYTLTSRDIQINNDGKRLECRYVVSEKDEADFVSNLITGIYFSTNLHPQVDINDFNRYTARKLSERFKCAYEEIKNKKIQ